MVLVVSSCDSILCFYMQLKEESANGESSASSSASVTGSPAQEEEPPAKIFYQMSRLLDEKLKEGANKASKKPQWEQQLENYTKAVHRIFQQHDDPIAFWTTGSYEGLSQSCSYCD